MTHTHTHTHTYYISHVWPAIGFDLFLCFSLPLKNLPVPPSSAPPPPAHAPLSSPSPPRPHCQPVVSSCQVCVTLSCHSYCHRSRGAQKRSVLWGGESGGRGDRRGGRKETETGEERRRGGEGSLPMPLNSFVLLHTTIHEQSHTHTPTHTHTN